MAPLRLKYELFGTGWSKCTIFAPGTTLELSASYLSDALANLLIFANAMASGFQSAAFGFDEEPGEYRWLAEISGVDLIRLRILEFEELWGNEPNSKGKVLLELDVHPIELAMAVVDAATDVLHTYGLIGYRKKWHEHPFPEQQLEQLKQTIESWSR